MKTWLVGAVVGACLGVALYMALSRNRAAPAESRHEPSAPAIPVVAAPAAPVVLAEVVEVTDIDHLLDPHPKTDSGIPFDEIPTGAPVAAPRGMERIPPAVDGPEPAPMPRAIPGRFSNTGAFPF